MSESQELKQIISFIHNNLKGKGILACSGGTDSTLLAVICSKAVHDQVLSVFVDTGLVRTGEPERVRAIFEKFNINGKIIDAKQKFLHNLKGIIDPEEKRKIIGKTFIEVFEDEAKRYGAEYLLQGTIAPDWIESGGSRRETIKTHHNVGGLPSKMNLKLVEPLRDLYKDDVRELSRELGLKDDLQPFPGPGLGVRIIGEITEEKLSLLKGVTQIVEDTIEKRTSGNSRPWQYFAVLLPVKTTGVHGDKRSYGYSVVIRCVDSLDAMTATFSQLDWNILEEMSIEITNGFPEINRVSYDITHKPPGTIEWE